MNIRPSIRQTALVSALAAIAVTALAANVAMSDSEYTPAPAVELTASTTLSEPVAASEPVATGESLSPNESVVAPASEPVMAPPVEERSVAQAGITVEERKLSNDERIQAQVIDKLAANPRLSGKIGVESHEAVVTLTGYTLTAGQAYRAGREAGSVTGVKYVQNEIRPRIGGSV